MLQVPVNFLDQIKQETIAFCDIQKYPTIDLSTDADEQTFTPIVSHKDFIFGVTSYTHKIFVCPECHLQTGIGCVLVPNRLGLFPHALYCSNKYKCPVENNFKKVEILTM